MHLFESCLLQEIHRLGATHTGPAMSDDLTAGIELIYTPRQIAQRNQVSPDVTDLIFVRFAHIEHEDVFVRVQTTFQLFNLDFRNSAGHRLLLAFFLTPNPAKLIVVYQFCDGAMAAASRTVRVLA